MALFNNNKVCSCGKIGCLETETSINVLLDKAKEGIANGKYPAGMEDVIRNYFENLN